MTKHLSETHVIADKSAVKYVTNIYTTA